MHVNLGQRLLKGATAWWLALPHLAGGAYLVDMLGRFHGSRSGASWAGAAGRPGGQGGLNFGGGGDVVLCNSTPPLGGLSALTVSAWVYPRSAGGGGFGRVVNPEDVNPWGLLISGANSIGFQTTSSITTSISYSVWSHVVGVWTGSLIQIYVNGVLAGGPNAESNALGAMNTLRVGNRASGDRGFDGLIDDVVVLPRAWSATEVRQWYDLSRAGYPGLIQRRRAVVTVGTAGIAFDAASNSGYQAAASTYSWGHTCTGGSRFLSVDVSLLSAGQTVSSITYNGVALSLIGARSTVTSFGRVECWGLVNPASGANTIVVALSGSIASAAGAVSYTGVNQSEPTEAFNSNQATNVGAADATVDVTTVADGDWVHAVLAASDSSVTATQTDRNNVTGAGGSGADEDFGPQTPAGTKTMSWTGVGALATWAAAGYAVRALGAPFDPGLGFPWLDVVSLPFRHERAVASY